MEDRAEEHRQSPPEADLVGDVLLVVVRVQGPQRTDGRGGAHPWTVSRRAVWGQSGHHHPRPPSGKRLTKSSSIAGITPLPMEVKGSFEAEEVAEIVVVGRGEGKTSRLVLMRTMSMPVERDDEDWRKRKEKQSLRRMEVKRRRSEKLRSYGSLGEIAGTSASPSAAAEAMD